MQLVVLALLGALAQAPDPAEGKWLGTAGDGDAYSVPEIEAKLRLDGGKLTALRRADGTQQWQRDLEGSVTSTPALIDRAIDGTSYGFRLENA